jgi:hypothetical protein
MSCSCLLIKMLVCIGGFQKLIALEFYSPIPPLL